MSKRVLSNIVLLLSLFGYSLAHRLYIVQNAPSIANFLATSFLILLTSLTIFLLGIKKDKITPLKKKINITVLIFLIIYFVISYLIGLEMGYVKNTNSLNLLSILNNIFVPTTIITCTEIFRYIIINANKDRKFILSLSTILIILFELCLTNELSIFMSSKTFIEALTLSIIPIISKNIVLSYLTYETGIKPTIFYRLVMELFIFVVPATPKLGNYLTSIIGVTLPVCIFVKASQIIDKHYGRNDNEKKKKTGFVDVVVVGMLAVVFFVACKTLPSKAPAPANLSNSIISVFNIGE